MLRRIRLAVTAVILLVAGTAVTAVAARDAYFVDRPLPGATVREARLAQPVTVVVDGRRVEVAPGRVLRVYKRATERAVQEAGRHSFLTRVQALADPSPPAIEVDPALIVRPGELNGLVDELAAELQQPVAANVVMRGVEPHVVAASPGQGIDRRALLRGLRAAALGGPRVVEARLVDVTTPLDTAAAEEAAETARLIVSAPVALHYGGRDVGELTPEQLARLLRFVPREDRFVVSFDRERLARAVQPSVGEWRRQARNARFALAGRKCPHRAVAPGPRREPETDARRGDRRRVLPHAHPQR